MLLLLLPLEILEEIGVHLSVADLSSLVQVSRLLHDCLVRTLYRLAQSHRTLGSTVLTNRLQDVTFWFNKCGNGSVLEWAIVHGRISTYKRFLSEPGTDLLQEDQYRVTLLHRLSGQGLVRYMEPLVEGLKHAGINPFQTDLSLLTPLHYAAARNMVEAVQFLIAHGAEVSVTDHHRNTPLHLAAVTGSNLVFAHLVRAGADVNAQTRFGWTPVDQASISHHRVAVNELERLGSYPPTWQHKPNALNEFVRLSPCPLDCYNYHMNFS
jgi:hypothetical protein